MEFTRRKETYLITNAVLTDPIYPRCRINGKYMYDEQIMSMPSVMSTDNGIDSNTEKSITPIHVEKGHYFFFIFNFENYYHFLYDTLPYLHFYMEVRKLFPACKLLVPSSYSKPLAFQKETLELFGIQSIEIARDGVSYEFLHVPTSLTHGKTLNGESASNLPPSNEAFDIWKHLAKQANPWSAPKRFYISRRSWIHGRTDNIGTNYTTRRRCMNEDALVSMLAGYGFQEVFCELLTMSEKIYLFQNATHVVGFIGGGMANLLFSPSETKVACIPTPDFLRINTRFQFSMNHTAIHYLECTELASYEGPFSLYTRVQHVQTEKVGEVQSWNSEKGLSKVAWSEKAVAGFSQTTDVFETEEFPIQLRALDKGLNSPFVCDLQNLRIWCEEFTEKQ